MTVAAPSAIGRDFSDAPPGHRFYLYFDAWQSDWSAPKDGDLAALQRVAALPDHAQALQEQLVARQHAMCGDSSYHVSATSRSPFCTGLGIEHPTENGFAFLWPYGLPYLAGSSIKGVLRRAAEELALGIAGEPRGWCLAAVWTLFGFDASSAYLGRDDSQWRAAYTAWLDGLSVAEGLRVADYGRMALGSEVYARRFAAPVDFARALRDDGELRRNLHTQGRLMVLDTIPVVPKVLLGNAMAHGMQPDILNPHYNDYYRQGGTPNDAGQPVPVFFLTVPPGSRFEFFVRPLRLPPPYEKCWRDLIDAAFAHAFDWLGFGAKTSVGYGHLQPDSAPVAASPPKPVDLGLDDRPQVRQRVRLTYNPSQRVFSGRDKGDDLFTADSEADRAAARAAFDALSKSAQKKARSGELSRDVVVRALGGNSYAIIELREPEV